MSLQVVIPLFEKFTALDGIGPYEVMQRIPELDIVFIGHERGVIRSENGMLGIEADATFTELPNPDVIVFPGGYGTRALMTDDEVLEWIRNAHTMTTFTTSVCTGSTVLAAAGILEGLSATTHWSARDVLTENGATPVPTGSSNTSTSASSPQRAYRAESTWRSASLSCSSTAPLPRPLS